MLVCATATELSEGSTTGVIVTLAVCVPPLYFAVIVAVVFAVTAVVCTVTLACFWPACTVMVAGTVIAALLLASVTAAPPAGAAALSVTLSCALAPPVRLAGETATELSVGSVTGVSVMLADCDAPLYVALIVAVVEAVTVVVCTVTLADFAPAGTVMVAGTGNAVLLLASATEAPPVGAG